jgi:ATP-dependent Clp protease ATP-binding subunit ClpB
MRFDNLTVKAQEALATGREVAMTRRHAEVQPEHLLVALIEQEAGLVPRILSRLGADPRMLVVDLNKALDRMPKVTGSALDIGISRGLKDLW